MKQNQLPVIPDFSIPPALYIQGLYKVNELMVKYGYLKAPIDIDAHIDTRFAVPIYEY